MSMASRCVGLLLGESVDYSLTLGAVERALWILESGVLGSCPGPQLWGSGFLKQTFIECY